jgi:hypothetical protein
MLVLSYRQLDMIEMSQNLLPYVLSVNGNADPKHELIQSIHLGLTEYVMMTLQYNK